MKRIYINKEPKIPFTKDGYRKLVEEKTKLTSERPEAVRHLADARSMGDLSENGYYKASRQRLSFLDSRIRRVDRLLRLAKIVESANTGSVDIGSNVTITDGNTTQTYTIVGGYESDPSKNTISYISPLGKALMGKQAGTAIEIQTPSGIKTYKILSIT